MCVDPPTGILARSIEEMPLNEAFRRRQENERLEKERDIEVAVNGPVRHALDHVLKTRRLTNLS